MLTLDFLLTMLLTYTCTVDLALFENAYWEDLLIANVIIFAHTQVSLHMTHQ
jgi:hypothetical protein